MGNLIFNGLIEKKEPARETRTRARENGGDVEGKEKEYFEEQKDVSNIQHYCPR